MPHHAPSVPRRGALAAAVLAAAVLAVASACAPATTATTPAPAAAPATPRAAFVHLVDSLVGEPQWRNMHWGILVVDPERSDTLYSLNAGKLFMPASNQKLLTGAVALEKLGPEYRFRTGIAVAPSSAGGEPVRDGVVYGDLVVTGYGDPSVSDHAAGSAMTPLLAIADSLRARGITRVRGLLVGGADNMPGPQLGFGWAWDDLDYPYSAGVDELFFNEGFTVIDVIGGASAGEPVRARTRPASSYPRLIVRAETVVRPTVDSLRPRPSVSWDATGSVVEVTGAIAAGDSVALRLTFRDQRAAYLAALEEALAARGIQVNGGVALTDSAAVARAGEPLFTVLSPTLAELMPRLQKPSQNQIAELFMRTLGLEITGVGSADSGQAVIERQMAAWGAPEGSYVVRDGSGLSRHDYVSPEAIIHVLDAMRQDEHFRLFHDALPIAGVDGTISGRMKGTPAAGNVHAKTGYIDRARSLSGYVTTADGVPLLFSILSNNWTTSVRDVERVQDAIAAHLAGMTLGDERAPVRAQDGAH
ncbi:MAG TPA: D-alanyl-D-alanine carboxypeptidase/D-alanyl-D-alanine-endopeptidase [Gemmatimonadales bacterium]